MKLWSRGLGRQELKMDFMHYKISRDGREVVISGRITDPVNWDFWIRFDEEDVPGLVRVAKNPNIIRLVFRRWFKKVFPFRRRQVMEESAGEATQEPVASASESGSGASESE